MGRDARERAFDAGTIGLAAGACALSLVTTLSEETAQPLVFRLVVDIGIGVVACVALLWRRRWPVWVAFGLVGAGLLSMTAFGATFVGLFGVAVRRSWPAVAAVAAVHFAPIVAMPLLVELSNAAYVEAVVFVGLLDATLIASGLLLRSARERARQVAEGQRLRIEEARRHERERIAREMHDVLAHRISLLAVHAGALEFRPDAPREQVQRAVRVIRQSAFDALEELREVIGVLRDGDDDRGTRQDHADPDPERPQPTLADVPELVDESRRAGTPVGLEDRVAEPAAVPVALGRHAYRIVQEGLTNARKHAPGAEVRVRVSGRPGGELTVELRNPLPAGHHQRTPTQGIPGAGAGLIGLRERAELAGGRLEHGRTADGDFRLAAALPWPG